MKSNLLHTSIAILNASLAEDMGFAALAFDPSTDQNGWCQLLPAGYFKAVDGRPFDVPNGQWYIDQAIAERLIAAAKAAANDLVIDYEHQTLNADINGQPAPAAGWFKEIEWRESTQTTEDFLSAEGSLSAGGSGLWIKPQWTQRARDFINNGEYRYLSAVFPYDKNTGEPLALHSAALVNRPGIDGLAIAALRAKDLATTDSLSNNALEDTPMNETLRKMLAKLGIEVSADAELTDAQSTAALSALDLLATNAGKTTELESSLASLKASSNAAVDLSQYVPAATYNALVTEVASLKADDAKNSAKQLIASGKANGKVLAAEEDYLNNFAEQQGVAALKSMLEGRPNIAALSSTQTTEIEKPDADKGVASLSADDKEAARLLGKTETEFAALKAL